MDTNTAIYNLKKLVRKVESQSFNKNNTSEMLLEIRRMLNSLDLREEANLARTISRELAGGIYSEKAVIQRIEHLISSFKKIKEKKLVMERREASARRSFFDKKKRKSVSPVNKLSLYDVILVPTQGGYHHCVISKIYQNERVVCYPMTTATAEDLDLIGCQSVKLEGSAYGRYQDTYITSSSTSIPYFAALNCYVGKLENIADVKDAIASFG